MKKDTLYNRPRQPVPPFTFNTAVADVFDDMIHRSVPMYAEVIRRQAQMLASRHRPDLPIFDLGCSTGNLAMALCEAVPPGGFDMVAVDSSQPMLDLFHQRLDAADRTSDVQLQCMDIRQVEMTAAGAVVVNYTLQFVPSADRDCLIKRIHDALVPGGMLLFSEKISHPDNIISDLQVDYYYRLKRENGYSDLEISQKREALENVLVPEAEGVHSERLRCSGFTHIDTWLKWFNFCSWVCIK
ncbi:MAG: carboxy-S-adenosyl-L-methionine synthase CmoA [Proteobacteria bacterium]|nr:MAG: carboxy-S-adenosyl-L-methionine synthase CmoA [Pseudomonadota bacterium]PIE68051.1 MAG: carboxy-S-adenosyl-L-methionine synthase CmoA [Deltaproteobacteria bacterium]